MQVYNDDTRSFCRRADATGFGLAKRFFFRKGDLYDQIHTTPQGSHRIGMEICRDLSTMVEPATLQSKN